MEYGLLHHNGYHLSLMIIAINSFGYYPPVTLLSKKCPKVGLLSIPKICAYVWVVITGLPL